MENLESMLLGAVYSAIIKSAISSKDGYMTVPELTSYINILPKRGVEMAKIVNATLLKISKFEAKHGRPMLTAIVCKQDKKNNDIFPSDWFFTCAKEAGYDVPENETERLTFWKSQFDEVHEYWNLKI